MDPRRETFRWIHWPSKVATVFGTRVAETILASVHVRTLKLGRTYGRKRTDQTLPKSLARGGPSTYEAVEPRFLNDDDRERFPGPRKRLLPKLRKARQQRGYVPGRHAVLRHLPAAAGGQRGDQPS